MLAVRTKPVPRSRPGRPSRAESSRIDARILDAAWQAFAELGYAGASMEAIAERAGVTRATLYQRHEDKIALFRATITSRGDSWSRVAQRMDWLEGDTLEVRLHNYSRQMLIWSQNSEVSANRRISEGIRGEAGPLAHELEQSFRRQITTLLADDIATHARLEGLSLIDPRGIAVLLIGMLESVIGEAQREGHDLDWMIEQGARNTDIVLAGRGAW